MDTVYCIITAIGTSVLLFGTKVWLAKLKRDRPMIPLVAECLALISHATVERQEVTFRGGYRQIDDDIV